MYNIHLNSVFSSSSLEEIKLLSLYYDKIFIIDDATFSPGYDEDAKEFKVIRHSFIPETFRDEYKVLIDEGVLEIHEGTDDNDFAKEISYTLNQCEEVIFPMDNKGNRILLPEVLSILTDVKKRNLEQDGVDARFIWWFYARKMQRSIKALLTGNTCISSSICIDRLLK